MTAPAGPELRALAADLQAEASALEPGGELHHKLTMAAAAAGELAGWLDELRERSQEGNKRIPSHR
jgi:hypothetical protein